MVVVDVVGLVIVVVVVDAVETLTTVEGSMSAWRCILVLVLRWNKGMGREDVVVLCR